jgi:hypothetical protein
MHSINLVSDELAKQVKRHRDKRRKRREARAAGQGGAVGEVAVLADDSDLGEPVVEGVLLDPDGERPADISPAA